MHLLFKSQKPIAFNFILIFLMFILLIPTTRALSGQEYMDRFNTYRNWNQHFPTNPTPEFFEFIKGDAALSVKLREKWLYELARRKDWTQFLSYFVTSKDDNLLCYQAIALYDQGRKNEAIQASIPLWLQKDFTTPLCSLWFNKLIKNKAFDSRLITQKKNLALNHSKLLSALKQKEWKKVIELIQDSEVKNEPCWQYWRARALEGQSKKQQALSIYQELAKNRHYYGFLASIRLNTMPHFENENPTTSLEALKPYRLITEEIKHLFLSKQSVQASRLLNDFISELPKEEASALVYWVDTTLHWYGKSVYLSNNELLNDQLVLRFPLAYRDSIQYYSKQYAISPEFVYAIIRQESGFREDVTSSAGARGLMQVMPNTASVVSKMNKIPYKFSNQLFLSQKNINIGIAYLQQLGKRFSQHPLLIAAAYNAGPKQVVYWLKNHPPKEIDLWIETLPWKETRNYLKNVMAFYMVYQYRLKQKPDLKQFLKPL